MIDVVTHFKDQAELLNFKFDFGTRAMLNFLKSNKVTTDIHLLLFSPLKWSQPPTEYMGGPKLAIGNFLFVVKSNLDKVIYRQKGMDESETKYLTNVEPLFAELEKFKNKIVCSSYYIEKWEAIDAYNVLDTNCDGLLVDFTVGKY